MGEPICCTCGKSGRRIVDCAAEKPECPHCKSEHSGESKECGIFQKEGLLIDFQEEKVRLMRARLILENNKEQVTQQGKTYATHFDCTMREKNKRKFAPWLLDKCTSNYLGSKPKAIRTLNKTALTIEVNCDEQSKEMGKLEKLYGIEVRITVNNKLSANKGLIYIYGYNMTDFEKFKKGLMEEHGLIDVVEPTWITSTRNKRAKPLLISF